MDFIIEFLTKNISSIGTYILFFLLSSAVLYHLSKLKNERSVALNTLQIIHTVLKSKLGDKADMLISIWIEGLKKIQDGEFSDEDGVDQFVRFLRLAAKNQGIELINPWKILFWTDSLKFIKNYTSDYIRKNKKILKTKNSIFKKGDSNKKICIGYYSSDFRNHALARSVIKILENHNKKKFEIFAFHFSKYPKDKLTFQISKLVDKFFDVSLDTDETIIQKSRNNNIDIAIDLTGFTLDNRINIFLNRLAPIQVNFLGYAGTISNYHDYIIADKYLVPKKYKKYYFEKIINLPGFFQPIGNENKIGLNFSREKFNLPPNDFIYCCYNSIYKINYEIFNCWMRILKKTKNSILCLPAVNNDCAQNIYSEVFRNNINKERIIF